MIEFFISFFVLWCVFQIWGVPLLVPILVEGKKVRFYIYLLFPLIMLGFKYTELEGNLYEKFKRLFFK